MYIYKKNIKEYTHKVIGTCSESEQLITLAKISCMCIRDKDNVSKTQHVNMKESEWFQTLYVTISTKTLSVEFIIILLCAIINLQKLPYVVHCLMKGWWENYLCFFVSISRYFLQLFLILRRSLKDRFQIWILSDAAASLKKKKYTCIM